MTHFIINRLQNLFKEHAMVLMYHRVCSPDADPWQLSVSIANFEQQLQVLQKAGTVVPLAELVERLHLKKSLKGCVCLTFDDGYVDNFISAKPLLEKYDMPATFFITQHNIGELREFWWDELERITLQTRFLPQQLQLRVLDKIFLFDLEEAYHLTQEMRVKHSTWNAQDEAPTLRALLYQQLWLLMSPLQVKDQRKMLEDVRTWADVTAESRPGYHSMSQQQLLALSGKGLFSLGSHTVNHPALSFHQQDVQSQEIGQNKIFLDELTGLQTSLFSYPSGKYNQDTLTVLKQQIFRAAFTTEHKAVNRSTDPFKIGRFQVNNWNGTDFEKKLRIWQHTI